MRRWTGVLAVLAAVALAAPAAHAAGTRSCGWTLIVSPTQANVLFPDTAATYWTAPAVPIPPGGHVEIHGAFPHARYTSLVTYSPVLQSVDGLNDTQIQADPGSTNPFLPGADRNAAKRDYTVRIVNARVPPSGRAPNTLYTTSADGSRSHVLASFILRIYEGDKGLDRTGGVPLPIITLVTSTGQRLTLPQCPDLMLPDLGLIPALANAGQGSQVGPRIPLGGTDPPVWHKFTNTVSGVLNTAGLTSLSPTTDKLLPPGGFADNPDNKYMTATFSQGFGQVLAFRAKAPSFPQTYQGEPTMGTGQLRYWSFCTNNQATMVYACRQDDQVPVDANGDYTVVVSTAAARPRNATESCGVAWLPAGPFPQSIVILRNMLPDPSFAEAIQNAKPGTEAQTLGDYYPRGTYYPTTADFERLGCPAD
jgi:hypothetical protein